MNFDRKLEVDEVVSYYYNKTCKKAAFLRSINNGETLQTLPSRLVPQPTKSNKWLIDMAIGTDPPSVPDILRRVTSTRRFDRALAHVVKAGLLGHGALVARLIAWASRSPQGCLARARLLFESTAMDDPLACDAMIRAYSASVFPAMALRVFDRVHRLGVASDGSTFGFALRACVRALKWLDRDCGSRIVCKGLEIHGRSVKLGFGGDRFVEESLLLFYSRCGRIELARQVFDEMSERSVGAWNAMISGYDRVGYFASSARLFDQMPVKNIVTWNTLLSRYVRLNMIGEAKKLFGEMPERDSVSWNIMISGFVGIKDYTNALSLFHEMGISNVEATEITLVSVLGACAETSSLEIGAKIHDSLKQKHVKIEGFLGNAIVDMYAKCGKLSSAREVFDELRIKPVSCWNAMIVGLAVHGRSTEALELFSFMENRIDDVSPNRVTFIGVLTACSHKGLVEEGRRYFNRMTEIYNIKPDEKHFGCVVNLLSRWGFLNEAYEMIETVPKETSVVLWRTLLGACVVHRNVEISEKCFGHLDGLGSLRDGDYVLLSNVYAETGRWNDVERMRDKMVVSGVVKGLGYSHYREL